MKSKKENQIDKEGEMENIVVFIFALILLAMGFLLGFGSGRLQREAAEKGFKGALLGMVLFCLIFYGYLSGWKNKYTLTEAFAGFVFGIVLIASMYFGYYTGRKK